MPGGGDGHRQWSYLRTLLCLKEEDDTMTADDISQIIVAGKRTGIVGLKKTLEEVARSVPVERMGK